MENALDSPIIEKVISKLETVPNNLHYQVLNFLETLSPPARHGVSGKELLRFAGTIEKAELESMRQAIESGCEQVDVNEW